MGPAPIGQIVTAKAIRRTALDLQRFAPRMRALMKTNYQFHCWRELVTARLRGAIDAGYSMR
jgi:hypothetical protein